VVVVLVVFVIVVCVAVVVVGVVGVVVVVVVPNGLADRRPWPYFRKGCLIMGNVTWQVAMYVFFKIHVEFHMNPNLFS
jgi:hypothetical protein